jgi:hypothetical protein
MSSGNPTKPQQACASKASQRRCTLWTFLSPRKWVEQTIHRAARPETQFKRQLRLHAFVSSLRAPVWASGVRSGAALGEIKKLSQNDPMYSLRASERFEV